MRYRLETVRVSLCRNDGNIRQWVDQEEIDRLGASLRERIIHPLILTSDYRVIDGGKRIRAALGAGIEELPAIITDEALTPEQVTELQVVSTFHRSDPRAWDKFQAMEAVKATHAGWSNKELATFLQLDPKMIKVLLSPAECVPEVQAALKEDKIGISVCHELSLLEPEQQRSLLQLKFSGASRDVIARQGRKQRNGTVPSAERVKRCRFPRPSGVVVSLAGEEMSLEDAATELSELAADMRKAKKDGLTIKTFMSNCRDRAESGV